MDRLRLRWGWLAVATTVGLIVWGIVAHFTGYGRHWDVGDPAWSPDGSKLAFHSSRRGDRSQIYVVDADGTDLTRLTHTKMHDREPAWSPEGKRIVFVSSVDDPYDTESASTSDAELYVMSSDGTGRKRITRDRIGEADPSWSPDGKRLAFAGGTQGLEQIYIARIDGTRLLQVRRLPRREAEAAESPAWAPDGSRLVFSVNGTLYVLAVRGKRREPLVHSEDIDGRPAWSPDGRRIAFDRVHVVLRESGSFDHLLVMNADGTGATLLTDKGRDPAWSPDGAKIAFVRGNGLFVINADGSGLHRITSG